MVRNKSLTISTLFLGWTLFLWPTVCASEKKDTTKVVITGKCSTDEKGKAVPVSEALVAVWLPAKVPVGLDPPRVKLGKKGSSMAYVPLCQGQKLLFELEVKDNYSFQLIGKDYPEKNFILKPTDSELEISVDTPQNLLYFRSTSHPEIECVISVCPSPFLKMTDKSGRFSIEADLPTGKHEIRFIHPKHGVRKESITVDKERDITIDFAIKPK